MSKLGMRIILRDAHTGTARRLGSRDRYAARPERCHVPGINPLDESLYQIDDQKQDHRSECGGNNGAYYASTQSQTKA
jgi:hypothetical protein